MESDTIANNRSRLVQISEGLYQHNGSGEYYARFWCKGKRIQQKLGTTESPCITLAEARRSKPADSSAISSTAPNTSTQASLTKPVGRSSTSTRPCLC
jgi:hypothetical protein